MTPKPHSALQAYEAGQLESGPYVINLCSSTTPMALAQPQAPELKRFTFFMSRRREDGRERFRLHMGYFVTAAEADEWLTVVREIFPGAWVGEAPGKRLRERQAANAQAAAVVTPAPAPRAPVAPPAAALPPSPSKAAPAPAARAPAQRQPARVPANIPTVHPARGAAPAPAARRAPVGGSGSNVREVLASLDGAPARAKAAQPNVAPPKARLPARPARAAAPPPAPARKASVPSISDTQVLRILEQRDDRVPADRASEDAQAAIALLKPEDTGTRRALREAVVDNRPVAFAVQLQWSVQAIDLQKVPPLAIFSAYTLYTVEGSREGRKWYGLRLGFFSDAISAKQVAYYVRSEFTTVAVVPVSTQERARATEDRRTAPSLARPIPIRETSAEEFKLLDDGPSRAAPRPLAQAPAASAAKLRPAAPRTGGRVQARAKARSETLEETLEILGASELEIDHGRGETLNDTGVRHLRVEVKKNTPFGRLLDALTERVKG